MLQVNVNVFTICNQSIRYEYDNNYVHIIFFLFSFFSMFRYNKRRKLYVSENVHPQTLSVVKTRTSDLDLEIIIGPINQVDLASREFSGILIQYPDTYGDVSDFAEIAKVARKNGVKQKTKNYFYIQRVI